jgi:PA14 domain-containing protein
MSSGNPHTYTVYALDQAGNVSAGAAATVHVPAVAASGVTGSYFDTTTFSNRKLVRTDQTVNFGWGSGLSSSRIGSNMFSVRWTGKLIPLANERYTFYTQSDDGVRLWINGQLVIDSWAAHSLREDRGSVALNANQAYDIKVAYYENTGSATMRLLWSSPSVAKQIVPASQLLAG